MATLPTVGGSDGTWGAMLNDFLRAGHEANGTHKKTEMLTDMGWSPTAYAGEESVTFPNGWIFKSGYIARAGATTPVVFGEAFTQIVSAQVTSYSTADWEAPSISAFANSGLSIYSEGAVTGFFWSAVGK